jgi:tRNA(fMet)-specific endonuclease VapC
MAGASHMIVCDTNILIEFYKNTPNIVHELQTIMHTHPAISAITQAELYFGAFYKAKLYKIKAHVSLLTVFPVTKSISGRFIEVMETYCLSHKLTLPDALIATTSLIHQHELYTLN